MTNTKATAPLSADQIENVDALISAQGGYHDSLIACIKVGILSAMFDRKHDAFTLILGRYAAARLSATEMQVFIAGKGKEYNAIRNRLTTAMARAAKDLAAIETEAAMTGKDKTDVAKGKAAAAAASKAGKAGAAKRSFVDLQMDALQAMYNRTHKDQVSDAPAAIKHRELIAMLERGADILGGKLKTPELPK